MSSNIRHNLKFTVWFYMLLLLLIFGFTFYIVSCGNEGAPAGDRQDADAGVVYASELTQYGITWTFDKTYPTGQFITGDYWVIGPVTIVSINPPSVETEEEINGENAIRIKNGSMINPDPNIGNKGYDEQAQGYDSHMWSSTPHYYDNLNVAKDISPTNPLIVQNSSSLISTISHPEASNRPSLQDAAILTVIDTAPPSDSFRPPYSGTDKPLYSYSTVFNNRGKLGSIPRASLPEVPASETAAEWYKRPWLDHIPGYLGERIHPINNMPSYGGNVANRIGEGALWLHLDFDYETQKKPVLIGLVQMGIDFYGIAKNGYFDNSMGKILQWWSAGGQCGGRKWPIVFAGAMLEGAGIDENRMVHIGSDNGILFQEDGQIFYVDQEAVNLDLAGDFYSDTMCGHNEEGLACGGYTQAMADAVPSLPDWGIAHAVNRYRDTTRWATMYRQCCTARYWGGIFMSILVMDLATEWDHDAFLDYFDRYVHYEETYNGGDSTQDVDFVEYLMLNNRDDYASAWAKKDWSTWNSIINSMY